MNRQSGSEDVRISEDRLMSFYQAIKRAEYIVSSRKPDLLIAPLRGAEPIIESMRVIARLEGHELPEVVYVETGTITAREDGKPLRPLFPHAKVDLVDKRLTPHLEGSVRPLRLCLIDEVEQGGSIVKNFDYVNGAMRLMHPGVDFELFAIAICSRGTEKCEGFNQLRMMGRIFPLFVDDLFTVDRVRFLSPLVRRGDDVQREGEYPRDSKRILYSEIERLHLELRKGA